MERIHTLIDKLYQQKSQGASSSHLLFTVQLLHQELASLQQNSAAVSSVKVAVTMPGGLKLNGDEAKALNGLPLTQQEKLAAREAEFQPKTPVASKHTDANYSLQKPSNPVYERAEVATDNEQQPAPQNNRSYNKTFEAEADVPTLAQYGNRTEVHQTISAISAKESLNEKLKQDTTEVAHLLKDAPVKDLRKAIGINDRFSFVKELFRGDEAMYERSVKTINNFTVYSEAQYWITRELQSKLGWLENNEAVRHFYNLVKRRFA